MPSHSDSTQTVQLDRYWRVKLETVCLLLILAHRQIPQNARYFLPQLITAHTYCTFILSSMEFQTRQLQNRPLYACQFSNLLSTIQNNRRARLTLQIAGEIKLLLYHLSSVPFLTAEIPNKIKEKFCQFC